MSRRTKREVAPPPRTTASSSCTRGVPASSAIPYPYGGPVPSGVPYSYQPSSSFPPGWFATTLSQAMASSSADLIGGGIGACPPPAAGVMDVHPDLEGWGRESRPPGGFVNYIKSPSNFVQHVLDGNQSQPINVDDAESEGATRTEKRLAWTKDEDLRLVSAWLNNSNDPIESNYKKNEQYWGDVAAVYNSTTPKNRIRQVKQVKDHFGKIKKKVGNFCCAWKEANSLYASGESKLDLMDKASKIYDDDFKDGPFMFMHCWNELKNQPKWHAYLDQLDKSKKRKLDINDVIPLDDDEDIPRPIGAKAAKMQRSGKGKGKMQDCKFELEDDIRKFMDAHEAAKEGQSEMLETQRRVSSENLEAKRLTRQTAMIETYRELMNKDTREMPDDVRSEFLFMLQCMREEIFTKNK